MPKPQERLMLAEQVFEVRHAASGSFLDLRGYVADYIRDSGFLPHWKIDINIVTFRDLPELDAVKKEGAFVGYRSAGYFMYDPQTRNHFVDRASSFWKILIKSQQYKIPLPERFGCRTKVFLPSDRTFEEINQTFYQFFYTEKAREVFGGTEKDVQFVIETKESGFDTRISGGPIHKGEVKQYLNFESEHFEKTGIFLDLDIYRISELKNDAIPSILHSAVDLAWAKIEGLAATLGV